MFYFEQDSDCGYFDIWILWYFEDLIRVDPPVERSWTWNFLLEGTWLVLWTSCVCYITLMTDHFLLIIIVLFLLWLDCEQDEELVRLDFLLIGKSIFFSVIWMQSCRLNPKMRETIIKQQEKLVFCPKMYKSTKKCISWKWLKIYVFKFFFFCGVRKGKNLQCQARGGLAGHAHAQLLRSSCILWIYLF